MRAGDHDRGRGHLAAELDKAAAVAPAVVLDLRGVDFFAAAGAGCVAGRIGLAVPLLPLVCHDPGPVVFILRVLGLDQNCPVDRDAARAVARLTGDDSS